MLLNIPLLTGFQLIWDHRQISIDENLLHANSRRRHRDYQPGDECLVIHYDPGPFIIEHFHINGTVTIRHYLNTSECLSI
jgi:hypothetical protein